MRTIHVVLATVVAASVALGVVALLPGLQAAPGGTAGPPVSKTVELKCRPGWRASAAGSYGGVSFGLACNNGRARVSIEEPGGTNYSVRVGVESETTAFDCFFSGDSAVVNESCADVMLLIR